MTSIPSYCRAGDPPLRVYRDRSHCLMSSDNSTATNANKCKIKGHDGLNRLRSLFPASPFDVKPTAGHSTAKACLHLLAQLSLQQS